MSKRHNRSTLERTISGGMDRRGGTRTCGDSQRQRWRMVELLRLSTPLTMLDCRREAWNWVGMPGTAVFMMRI